MPEQRRQVATLRPKLQRQCKLCPWKLGTDPTAIPWGYDADKHRALAGTIAEPGSFAELISDEPLRIMACHHSTPEEGRPCVGWLHNQLGEGNNLALRYAVRLGRINGHYEIDGPQHDCFDDTLPEE